MLEKLYVINEEGTRDITEQVGNLSWQSDSNSLSVNLSFDYAALDGVPLKPFDQILFDDQGEAIFFGVVTSLSFSGEKTSVSAFDFGFYLNKSEVVIQFNQSKASTAVEMLLKNVKMKCGKLPMMTTIIHKIYKDVKVSDVLSDILEQVFLETGRRYFFEMSYDVLNVHEVGEESVDISYSMAENLAPVFVEDVLSKGLSMTDSVENLRNSVVVVSSESDATRIIEEVGDSASIASNGLLREVMTVDFKNESEARNISRQLLKTLNKKSRSLSLPLLGHKALKKNRRISLDMPELEIQGEFLIQGASHSYAGGLYKTTIDVEVIE